MSWSIFAKYLSSFSYLGIAGYFSSVGYVVPVPEEVVLIILGFLAGVGKFHFWGVFASALAGVLATDNILYWLARKGSRYVVHMRGLVREDIWTKYERLMGQYIGRTMLALRFLVGFRFLGPVVAGSLEVGWKRFFLYDLAIVVSYIGAFMWLGFSFRHRLGFLIAVVEQSRSFFLAAAALALLAILLKLVSRRNGQNGRSPERN